LKSSRLVVASLVVLACVVASATHAPAQQDETTSQTETSPVLSTTQGYDLKVPEGFQSEAVDEAGILKWKKDSGEILLVIGDLFLDSGDTLFKALKESVEKDKRWETVRVFQMGEANAILFKEKPPEDTSRLRTWRLIVVTAKKIVNLECSAPGKDFDQFAPAFEQTIESFALKPSAQG
jgi:hypothetical protein